MGGQANTPTSNTWSMLTWDQNSWGAQDTVTVSVTGQSATSSVGDGTNMGCLKLDGSMELVGHW